LPWATEVGREDAARARDASPDPNLKKR
jgi:hypothetical protein